MGKLDDIRKLGLTQIGRMASGVKQVTRQDTTRVAGKEA